ncbi:TRAP transporter large permease subunit [Streptomyces sp. NPDC053474]|uniref:TRAP transporter large permease subunit n=1 Tax=Streptomyces sp. NPDC053474 TaxID=3365704 RepID=UPI0037D59EBE
MRGWKRSSAAQLDQLALGEERGDAVTLERLAPYEAHVFQAGLLVSELLTRTGLRQRMIDILSSLLGRRRGGSAYAATVASSLGDGRARPLRERRCRRGLPLQRRVLRAARRADGALPVLASVAVPVLLTSGPVSDRATDRLGGPDTTDAVPLLVWLPVRSPAPRGAPDTAARRRGLVAAARRRRPAARPRRGAHPVPGGPAGRAPHLVPTYVCGVLIATGALWIPG